MSFRLGLGSFAACCALMAIPQFAAAQTKVGIVNMQQAVLGTAEIKKAEADLQSKYAPRQAEMDKANADLAKLSQQIQNGQDTMTAQALGDLQAQAAKRQRELTRMQEDVQADSERDRNDILSGASSRMNAVVTKLAVERGFDLVVDATSTYYFKEAMDFTKDAIAAYDKAYPVAAAAAAPAKPAGK